MLKRTLLFENPALLSRKNNQLEIKLLETGELKQTPIEDIGVLILEHPQITVTHSLLTFCAENQTVVVTCSSNHMPSGIFLPIDGHHLQQAHIDAQWNAKKPKRKAIWQTIIKSKITNQGRNLETLNLNPAPLFLWAKKVSSGDGTNLEARAAKYYWQELFKDQTGFTRDQDGNPPNNLLNYGYAILRSVTARAVVASGLHPSIGVHHQNEYNAWCLADDLMEPYRPFVDRVVREIADHREISEITRPIKAELLKIPVLDVKISGERSPLAIAVQQTTSSLAQVFLGNRKELSLPEWP
ncbi:MAG: type II CRISPR-associated endonuclease Cas1 [Bacteroidetes bacterium]|nr:type II CRISPR-associated endonuclease Cas1 [Bacteroidota bacterium]